MPPATNISVTNPVSPAIELVKRQLFQPFNIEKWFTVGLCAWLAHLGETGFNFNFRIPGNRSTGTGGPGFREMIDRAHSFVMDNLGWILPLAIVLVVLMIVAGIVMLWLKSRGAFMFLHCVAYNKAEVEATWKRYGQLAHSLFEFRVVMMLVSWVIVLPLVIWGGLLFWKMYRADDYTRDGIIKLVVLGMMWLAISLVSLIIRKFTKDFVVPVMFLHGKTCLGAWREFLDLLADNAGHFILYLLFQIVLVIAVVIIVLAAVLVTCCIAGCLMAIPYLGTVVLLPVLIFGRAYSLIYFAQYGREYDVFPPPVAPA